MGDTTRPPLGPGGTPLTPWELAEWEATERQEKVSALDKLHSIAERGDFNTDSGDALRANGFTDPARQVDEMVGLLRIATVPGQPENIIQWVKDMKELLDELDDAKQKENPDGH